MKTQEQLVSMADDIDQHGRGLTDWEAEFLDNMMRLIEDNHDLTQKQGLTLEGIYRDRVSV